MPARPPATRIRTTVPGGASFKIASYASDQGKRSYKLYIPAKSPVGPQPCAPMPLIVMLHGCGQTPDDFAAGTRMNALARAVRPPGGLSIPADGRELQQVLELVQPQRSGPGSRRAVADRRHSSHDLRDHPADPARVYIAGLSAGASAAIIAATAYPDLFAAGVLSGLPAGAAHNAASGFLAMQRGAPGDRPTVAMPTIVFHGDADTVVHPRNGRFVVARSMRSFQAEQQWATMSS